MADLNENQARIIAKIKKCLALAESSVPAEAEAALRQAQKLMEKYNIDLATVERPEVKEVGVRSRASISRPKRWEVLLVHGICKAFGLRFYFLTGASWARGEDIFGKYMLIGTTEQTVIAEWTCNALFDRLAKQKREFYKTLSEGWAHKAGLLERKSITKELDSFCLGWVAAVVEKVQEMANPKNLQDAIDNKLESLGLTKKVKDRVPDDLSAGALRSGRSLGEKESIHRPMNGAGPKPTQLEYSR